MARLIDADSFSEQYGNYYAEQGPANGFIGTVGDLIAKQPTIEAQPVWIPCSEKKPEKGSAIIVYCADHDKNTGIVENCIIPKDFDYLRNVLRENGVYSNSLYWMPLPAPPEVKQNE